MIKMIARSVSRSVLVLFLILSPMTGLRNVVTAARQSVATTPSSPRTLAELQERIALLLDQPKFGAARWGVRIVSDAGTVLFDRDSDKAFTPASNMKLYTSSAALDLLGADFRIETSVYVPTAQRKRGLVRGDLVFFGRGDPNLSARFASDGNPSSFKPADTIPAIEALADEIKSAGVRRISGDVIGDDSYFATDRLGASWEWDDVQFYYGAEISELTVNDNVVTFTVTPAARPGVPPTIKVQPATSYVKIVNNATTSGGGLRRIGVNRQLNSNTVEFFGTIPRGGEKFEVHIAVHDPALFAATLLKEALARRGILTAGRVRSCDALCRVSEPLDLRRVELVAKVVSAPLSTILQVVNKPSQNLHTELLLRQIGTVNAVRSLNEYGRPQSSDSLGNAVRRRFLERAGVDVTPLSLRDGSGLSRQDLVTPRATVQLLEFMRKHPQFEVFRNSLPVAGIDGTLERRMKSTSAEGNVRAKTGSLSYVNTLSGYLRTKGGMLVTFSLMGNNYTGPARDVTETMDQICNLLVEFDATP